MDWPFRELAIPIFPGPSFDAKVVQLKMKGVIYFKMAEEGREMFQAHWIFNMDPCCNQCRWQMCGPLWTYLEHHKEPSHQRKPPIWDDYPRQVRARLAEELCNFSEGMLEIVGSVEILWIQIQKVHSNTGAFSTTISKETHCNQNGVIKMTDPKLDMFLVFLSVRTPLATSPVVNFDLANPLKFPDLGYLGCFRATILPSCRVKPPTMVAGYLTCLQLKSFFETGAAWTKHECFIL